MGLIASLHLDTARWLRNSVLAPYIEAFVAHLREGRYAARTIKLYLNCIAHSARWLSQADRSLALVDEALVEAFLGDHVAGCGCPAPATRSPRDLHAACASATGTARVRRYSCASNSVIRGSRSREYG